MIKKNEFFHQQDQVETEEREFTEFVVRLPMN